MKDEVDEDGGFAYLKTIDGDEDDDDGISWGGLLTIKPSGKVLLTNLWSLLSTLVMILDDDGDFASESEILFFCV